MQPQPQHQPAAGSPAFVPPSPAGGPCRLLPPRLLLLLQASAWTCWFRSPWARCWSTSACWRATCLRGTPSSSRAARCSRRWAASMQARGGACSVRACGRAGAGRTTGMHVWVLLRQHVSARGRPRIGTHVHPPHTQPGAHPHGARNRTVHAPPAHYPLCVPRPLPPLLSLSRLQRRDIVPRGGQQGGLLAAGNEWVACIGQPGWLVPVLWVGFGPLAPACLALAAAVPRTPSPRPRAPGAPGRNAIAVQPGGRSKTLRRM